MRTLQEELKCMREGLHYDAHTPEMYAYMQLKEFLSISVLLFWMVLKLLLAGKR